MSQFKDLGPAPSALTVTPEFSSFHSFSYNAGIKEELLKEEEKSYLISSYLKLIHSFIHTDFISIIKNIHTLYKQT